MTDDDLLHVLTTDHFQIDEVRGAVNVKDPSARKEDPPKTFTFDTVFAPNCKQVDVYNKIARPIVESVLGGYNGREMNGRKEIMVGKGMGGRK